MSKAATAPARRAASKAAWQALAVHTVTCPSGAEVKIRIPNLPTLLAGDAVPERLRTAAIVELAGGEAALVRESADGKQELDPEMIRAYTALRSWIVTQSVIDPEISEDDIPVLPQEDVDMLSAIASRERDVDALGVRLGVEPLSRWETFRRFHGCVNGCEACEASRSVFSEPRPGPV